MMTRKKIASAIDDMILDQFGPCLNETEEEKRERQEFESLQSAEAGPRANEFFHVDNNEEATR
tara:strand:- start:314 stop:502 length:189 start_codon:yes stop_codon:yes gene_type:complete